MFLWVVFDLNLSKTQTSVCQNSVEYRKFRRYQPYFLNKFFTMNNKNFPKNYPKYRYCIKSAASQTRIVEFSCVSWMKSEWPTKMSKRLRNSPSLFLSVVSSDTTKRNNYPLYQILNIHFTYVVKLFTR